MFLTSLATKPRYSTTERLNARLAKHPALDYSDGLIHYANSPNASMTSCGIFLQSSPGVRYSVDKDLLVGQCSLCDVVAHLSSKENAMTRAGIDCQLYPADTVLTAGD